METPKTKAGKITEEIMTIFWVQHNYVQLPTDQYNRVYEHVLHILQKHLEN